MLENRILWKVLVPKWDKVTREWRRLHNEKLCDLYSSPSIWLIKPRIRCVGFIEREEIGDVRTGEGK